MKTPKEDTEEAKSSTFGIIKADKTKFRVGAYFNGNQDGARTARLNRQGYQSWDYRYVNLLVNSFFLRDHLWLNHRSHEPVPPFFHIFSDTGVDYKHPALGGCFGSGCKVAFGHDFVGDAYDNGSPEKDVPKPDKDPMDCAGHGTHVAGIVAARNEGPHALGLQRFVGVAPDGMQKEFG